MARKVFFSFAYEDVQRVMIVRNSNVIEGAEVAGYIDKAAFESIEKRGDQAVRDWIDAQLQGTSVTVVLVGAATCNSKWVKYEVAQSIARGNGLLGIDISKIKNLAGETSDRCGKIPSGYPFYLWNTDDGYTNLGKWVEDAATVAGR